MTAPLPLTAAAIDKAIQDACDRRNQGSRWNLRRAVDSDVNELTSTSNCRTALSRNCLYGFVASMTSGKTRSDFLTFFNISYSTWDGRVLYVDKICLGDGGESSYERLVVWSTLAKIAINLHCTRITWQRYECNTMYFPEELIPEAMAGWLTLHWSKDDMYAFLYGEEAHEMITVPMSNSNELNVNSEKSKLSACIAAQSATLGFRLRLAESSDLSSICRLVQGLADFEKEPNAVHVTGEHYRSDGLNTAPPLFYCVLIDMCLDEHWSTCGMAFCYTGYTYNLGHYLYLEDLFIESKYRGKGAGSFVMRTLAAMALALECSMLKWQALDWNTPALAFYNKIGARVVDGLLTNRFMGSHVHTLASLPNS